MAGPGGELTTVFVNVVPSLLGINDAFKGAGGQGAEAFAQGFKGAGSDMGWKSLVDAGVKEMSEGAKKMGETWVPVFKQIREGLAVAFDVADTAMTLGAKAGESFMTGMRQMMEGKADFGSMLDLFSQNFNRFENAGVGAFDALAGKIPLVGGLMQDMAGEAKGAFDTVLGLADQWLDLLADVGTQWQETERTIATHTLNTEDLEKYMSVVQEVAASGVLVHFKDVAEAIALVNARLPQLQQSLGVEGLKDFTVTLAQASEILGDIHINVRNVTAAMNSFNVPADQMKTTLIEMTNTARATGMDFNELASLLDRLGPQFGEVGLSIEDAMYLLSEMNKEGIRTTQMVYGFGSVLSKLNTEVSKGIFPDMPTAFKANMDEIVRELNNKDPQIQALGRKLIENLWGRRFQPAELKAIQDGLMQVTMDADGTLHLIHKDVGDLKQPFGDVIEQTATLRDRLEAIGQQIKAAFMPVALAFSKGLEEMGTKVSLWLQTHGGEVTQWLTDVSSKALTFASHVLTFAGESLIALAPVAEWMKNMFVEIGRVAIIALTPVAETMAVLGSPGPLRALQEGWKSLGDLSKMDLVDPMKEFGQLLKTSGDTWLPALNNEMTKAGTTTANILKMREAMTQMLPGEAKPGEGIPKPEPRAAFEVTPEGELKLIGDKEKTKKQLHDYGVDITYDLQTGVVTGIKTLTPEAKEAWDGLMKEVFQDPKKQPKITPQYVGPDLPPGQVVKPLPPLTMDDKGLHLPVIPELKPPPIGPGIPGFGAPGFPGLPGTPTPTPPGRIQIPLGPMGPHITVPTPHEWLKHLHMASWDINDQGEITIPASFGVSDKTETKSNSDIMDALGVPREMQKDDKVVLSVGFDMSQAASPFGGMPGMAGPTFQNVAMPYPTSSAVGGAGAQSAVHTAMLQAGFPESEWPALSRLIEGESGWNPTAVNPSSGAFGLFQFLGGTQTHYLPGKSPDPYTQALAGMRYIMDRYGSPSNALGQWMSRSPHWYGSGGQVCAFCGGGHATAFHGGGTNGHDDPAGGMGKEIEDWWWTQGKLERNAAGGPIPWLPGSRMGEDSIFAALTPGEHVFTKDEVDRGGGHGVMYAIRRALRAGKKLFGFQGGGYGSAAYAQSGRGDDIMGVNSEIMGVDQIAHGFGLTLTAGRSGHGTHPVDRGYHDSGAAGDFSNGVQTPQELGFAMYMMQNYGPSLAEVIHSSPMLPYLIKDGHYVKAMFYGADTLAGHRDHVHIASVAGSSPALEMMSGGMGGGMPGMGGGAFTTAGYSTMGGGGGFGAAPADYTFGGGPGGGGFTFGGGGGFPAPPGPGMGGGFAGQPGYVTTPATPVPGIGPGPQAGVPGAPQFSPYGPLPPYPMTQDDFNNWKRSWDERTLSDMQHNEDMGGLQDQEKQLQEKINSEQSEYEEAVKNKAAIEALGADAQSFHQTELDQDNAKINAYNADKRALASLHNQQMRNQLDVTEPKPYPEAPGMKDYAKGMQVRGDAHAEQLGKGLVQGLFQEMGFPDVFGKPFTEWGIWKLMMGGLGFGVGLLQNMGKYPTGMFGPGGPFYGHAWGSPQEQAQALAMSGQGAGGLPLAVGGLGGMFQGLGGMLPNLGVTQYPYGGAVPYGAAPGPGTMGGPPYGAAPGPVGQAGPGGVPQYSGPPRPQDPAPPPAASTGPSVQGPPPGPGDKELRPNQPNTPKFAGYTYNDWRGSVSTQAEGHVQRIAQGTSYVPSGPTAVLRA